MYNKLAVDIGTSFFGGSHFLGSMTGVSTLVGKIAQNLLIVAGIVLIMIIIYGGYMMINAAGDSRAYEQAQKILTTGIVGFIIAAGAWVIVKIVEVLTGTTIL